MIYARVEGHDWNYEIENVARLFFPGEKTVFLENHSPDTEHNGFLIYSSIKEEHKSFYINTILYAYGKIAADSQVKLTAEGSETAKANAVFSENSKHREKIGIREVKREVKRQVYICLSSYFKKELPWGTLTGIRPAKLVHEMMEKGIGRESIEEALKDYYKVSPSKTSLVIEIAENELPVLKKSVKNKVGLYIGVPFCPSRCLYCSFTSNPIKKNDPSVARYLEAIKKEISGTSKLLRDKNLAVQSIYIGGGTPTALDAPSLKELLKFVEQEFDLGFLEEYTLEAGRPDSIDEEKLMSIRSSKVDRISINPQSMNDSTLKVIGRNHSSQDILKAFHLARSLGFNNINMDVIAGLPGEDTRMFINTLEQVKALDPENLTVHSMALKRASRLIDEKECYSLAGSNAVSQMVDTAYEYAKDMGMVPYYLYRQKNMVGDLENIGYCKPGHESIYNVHMMEEKQTIVALGPGAISKAVFHDENRIERAANVKNTEDYFNRTDEMIERKKELLKNL